MKLHRALSSLVLLGATLATTAPAPAQQKSTAAPDQATTTLSVDARLVNIPVVVRDKKGALVQNLTKADFALQVDGHSQTIRYFDLDANLPLTLGLLVDTSLSQRSVLDDERTASGTFLEQMLTAPPNRDPDKAFVIQFAGQVELLQDLTPSRPKLQAALKQIGTSSSNDTSSTDTTDDSDNNRSSRRAHGGTALYDATFLASDELMSKQKGRKALIILSDGVDMGSRETITKAIEAAQRADTVIYSIYFKGEEPHRDDDRPRSGGRNGSIGFPGGGRYPGGGGGYPGGGGGGGGQRRPSESRTDGKKILDRMSLETGGRLFEVSKKQTTAQIYTQIAEELRAQYRLGYTPDAATAAEGYHQIDLKLSQPDMQKKLTIQTRDGYYTGK
jgi:VWFA-related protein